MNQTDPTAASVREQLLDALDFSYCQGLGYAEPAELLAAYDRERVAVVSPPPSRAAVPTDWVDGHPQLEAIAAAVWERCEHHDSGLVIDDPRNIAVAALAAVLPEQADRAAVLSDAERTMLSYALDQAQERIWSEDGFTDEDQAAVDSLRRLAVEAHDIGTQQPEAHANGLPLVKGNCPACRRASLFLGTGGYPTCSNADCPEPDAATTVLEEPAPVAQQLAAEAHSCSNCEGVDPTSCLMNPNRAAAEQQPAPDDEEHVCKPGAQLYYCPTAGEVESDCHGGFDVCCGRPDLHQPVTEQQTAAADGEETRTLLRCNWAHTLHEHAPHDWEPQPGMDLVRCPGYTP